MLIYCLYHRTFLILYLRWIMKKYGIGDKIKYGAYGECLITDMRKETIGGKQRDFFVLSQKKNSCTILVPFEKAECFREVKDALSVDEIKALRLVDRNAVNWELDDKSRDAEFKKIFDRDEISEIAAAFLSITEKQNELKTKRKKLRVTDLNAYKVCERILYDELSRTLDLQTEDLVSILNGELEPVAKQ